MSFSPALQSKPFQRCSTSFRRVPPECPPQCDFSLVPPKVLEMPSEAKAGRTWCCHWVSQIGFRTAQTAKHLPTRRKTWVQSLGQEDPLEKEMAPYSSTLAWKIPWAEERSLFSTPPPAFTVCRLFDDGHSDRCEVISHCSFFNWSTNIY